MQRLLLAPRRCSFQFTRETGAPPTRSLRTAVDQLLSPPSPPHPHLFAFVLHVAACIIMPHESHQLATFISRHLFSGPALQRIPSPEWSGQGNQIAIMANKSLLVLKPVTCSRSFKTKSCLSFDTSSISIENSESDDTPGVSYEMLGEIFDRLESEQDVFLAKMDRLISCDPETRDNSSICSAKWAPGLHHNPVLAVLTDNSGILFFQKRQNRWIALSQVQDYLRKTLRSKRQDHRLSQLKSYEQLKHHFYRTGITALAWARPDDGKDDEAACLITASKGGFLFFWRMSVGQQEEGGGEGVRLELRHEWDSSLGQVTRLDFVSDYLLIGTHSGQLALVHMKSLYSSAAGDDVNLRPVFVWEEKDDLSADHFLAYKLPPENSFLIILPKGTFLVLLRVSLGPGGSEELDRQEVVVEGRNQMPVTAMCKVATQDESLTACLISSADGSLIHVQLPVDPFAATACIQQKEVTVEGLLKSRATIYGLTSSPFHVFTAALQTIAPYRDTSIVREGSILLIFPSLSFQQVCEWLSRQEQSADQHPAKTIEFVMAFRAFLDRGESFETQFLQSDFASRSIASLKVSRHKILAIRDFLAKDGDKHDPDSALLLSPLVLIEELVFKQHVLQVSKSSSGGAGLSQDQHESLALMRFWYKRATNKNLPPGSEKSSWRTSSQSTGSSPCPICSKPLPLSGATSCCPDGHVFSRCSSSLLCCDPISGQIDCCFLCRRCYRFPAIWEPRVPCIFCY